MSQTFNPLITVYAEATPNPSSMKFVLNTMLIDEEGRSVEFRKKEKALASPLALKLFDKSYVKGVFITSNFVTVSSDESVEWYEVIPELKELIKMHIAAGEPVFTGEVFTEAPPEVITSDLEQRIIALLDEYIRPAVEGDGGAIHFKSYDTGTVTVVLKGSCSGCPSSTLTLKSGIENLLRRMVPEVEEVIAESA
jgi:Fe-S cluster biogenesis protein NfuA